MSKNPCKIVCLNKIPPKIQSFFFFLPRSWQVKTPLIKVTLCCPSATNFRLFVETKFKPSSTSYFGRGKSTHLWFKSHFVLQNRKHVRISFGSNKFPFNYPLLQKSQTLMPLSYKNHSHVRIWFCTKQRRNNAPDASLNPAERKILNRNKNWSQINRTPE